MHPPRPPCRRLHRFGVIPALAAVTAVALVAPAGAGCPIPALAQLCLP